LAPIITIDGPSGSGKGTIAERVAAHLGWHLLDSGAIYRVLGLLAARQAIGPENPEILAQLARDMPLRFTTAGAVWLGDEEVSREIRTETAGNQASRVAAVPEVRAALLDWQRGQARMPGLVADGRDMGSVVFPAAQVKIFLTASAEERAQRRHKQLMEKGMDVNLASLTAEIRERDERDRTRAVAPLVAAPGALTVDSTGIGIEEVFSKVLEEVNKKLQ
jgi:cytidylate kinase